ncbi:MAG: VanW family protein [Patescibacteria group bacterium]|nr:VanW family protein [Patescibacteria group bacterium]
MENNNLKIYKKIGFLTGVFFIFIILPLCAYLFYENKYEHKIYKGARIGAYDFSGLDKNQAKKKLNKIIKRINQEGITFHYHNQNSTLYPIISSLEGDIAIEVLVFDIENTVERLYTHARKGSFLQRLITKIKSLKDPVYYYFMFAVNHVEMEKFFLENFSHFASPGKNARLAYKQKNAWSDFQFYIKEEEYGQTLNWVSAIQELKRKLNDLDTSPTTLSATIDYPKIYKKDLLNIELEAEKIIALSPLNLKYSWKSWKIDKMILADWLVVKNNLSTSTDAKHGLGFDYKLIAQYLKENIAPAINIEPIEAKFEMEKDKVVEFQESKNGQELTLIANAKKIEKEFILKQNNSLELTVAEKESEIITENINNLGIKELLGTGHSNFAGSPSNRRHNIAVGATSVNGTILEPGEEFSLLSVLGEINASTDYLPELVIKENRTIPEYGGGLCQIGTTAFRGTLAAGLPVTTRRNHSYRVSYYEPAGTDATIYDPWPDYKFKNDYKHHVLITARIEGNDLYFDFWGTKDGREATTTYPIIYNITKPDPTLIIETPDLAPGEKKCTEHAHNGASAYFDYSVKYPETNIPEELKDDNDFIENDNTDITRFKSYYTPWREVCLIGIDPNKTASSTHSESAN